MTCCAYSCTQYGLHTQYMLCVQLHTVRSPYTVHAVPTAARSTVSIHSTCCAYSCTQCGLHTQYMLLTNADDLLCLQLHTVRSPHSTRCAYSCTQYGLHTQYILCLQLHTVRSPHTVHAVPTAAHSTVYTHSTCCAYSCTQYGLHTQYMLCLQLHTVMSRFFSDLKIPIRRTVAYPCHLTLMCTVRRSNSDCKFDLIFVWSWLNFVTFCPSVHDFGFHV